MVKFSWVVKQAAGADIASAATVNLALATGNSLHITGSTWPITSFWTVDVWTIFTLIFDSTPTLTHNATSLILPGSANIVAAAGDTMVLRSKWGGNWESINYSPKSGTPVIDVVPSALFDSSIPTWEAITAGQTVYIDTVPTFAAAVGLWPIQWIAPTGTGGSSGVSSTTRDGIKISVTTPTTINTVNRVAGCTPATCYITNSAYTVLYTATFSGDVATFTNATLSVWTYYIMMDSGWASYTMTQYTGCTYPVVFTSGTITAGSVAGTDSTSLNRNVASFIGRTENLLWDVAANTRISFPVFGTGVAGTTLSLAIKKIASPSATFSFRIETDNAGSPSGTPVTNGTGTIGSSTVTTSFVNTTLTLAGSVTLTDGKRYHLVLFAGTYGSETINSTNYYAVGFAFVSTSIRPTKTWNGTVWSSAASTTFCYCSSTLFRNLVLQKGYIQNKFFWISSETKAVGLFPKITIAWINSNQSGLTENTVYYSDGSGGISASVLGTFLGRSISATQLFIYPLSAW